MSHIEKKKINGRVYLYRYESYRDESGRPRKRMLEYLGPESPKKTAAKPDSSHVVRKKLNGRYYLYLYHSYRDGRGKAQKKMVKYLGPESDFECIVNGLKARKASAVGVDDGRT